MVWEENRESRKAYKVYERQYHNLEANSEEKKGLFNEGIHIYMYV